MYFPLAFKFGGQEKVEHRVRFYRKLGLGKSFVLVLIFAF